MIQSQQVAEFAVWRAVAKVVRQHSGRFNPLQVERNGQKIVVLHNTDDGIALEFGYNGQLKIETPEGVTLLSSHESVIGADFNSYIEQIEIAAGLPTTDTPAHTSTGAISYLVIEELLRSSLFKKTFFTVEACAVSTENGPRLETTRFPQGLKLDSDPLGSNNTRYWYLNKTSQLRNVTDEPTEFVFDLHLGYLYTSEGKVDLQQTYQAGGRDLEKMVQELFERRRRRRS